jgi:hypothetical protein
MYSKLRCLLLDEPEASEEPYVALMHLVSLGFSYSSSFSHTRAADAEASKDVTAETGDDGEAVVGTGAPSWGWQKALVGLLDAMGGLLGQSQWLT